MIPAWGYTPARQSVAFIYVPNPRCSGDEGRVYGEWSPVEGLDVMPSEGSRL